MATRTRGSTANGTSRSASSRTSPEPKLAPLGKEIQRFGIAPPPADRPAGEARAESCRLLNEILADSMMLYAMYKKHHWLVAGPTFYQLHLLFDKHAEEQLELIDLLAERVQSLGGIAVGDPRHAAELTTIERPPNGAEDVPAMIHRLLDAHETIIEKVRDGDRHDRGERGLGLERHADERRPPPPRAAGLVRGRARGRRCRSSSREGAGRLTALACVGACAPRSRTCGCARSGARTPPSPDRPAARSRFTGARLAASADFGQSAFEEGAFWGVAR